ncbi:esterase FE4-like [Pectinophora gossypiella]|nr:esterase FE4-like [Pectinophora gossypiella]
MSEGKSQGMKWVVLLWLVAAALVREPAPLVRTRSGLVRGVLSHDRRSYQYFGIPYGRVDRSNRFQAPLPPPTWEGVFDAMEEHIRCPQAMGPIIMGDPDCLRVNVYTPTRVHDEPLPVMVFIHGGSFFEGTGTGYLYGADEFPEHGVVFVGVNYRLNVEGFLCLGIKEAPGNAGLKDQIAALRWVKENIRAFGGDPNNVMLFGESAGAVSTSYLVLSQAAKGLFHKAILQSGSSLAPWGMQRDPIKTASNLAKEFGHDTKDPQEIHSILSNKSVEELISAIKYSERKNYITAETLFVPCIEKVIPGVEPVVTRHPTDIIRHGNYTKVPMIIGFNDNEGLYFVSADYGINVKEVNPVQNLQNDLEFPSDRDKNETVERIKEEYFSAKKDLVTGLVELYSDLHFKIPTVLESSLYAQTTDQPIYYYLFKYNGYINVPKLISMFWFKPGASHADELFYLFKPHSFPMPWRRLERNMIQRMLTLWTNFAKYSDPTPRTSRLLPLRWRPSRQSNPTALVLDHKLGSTRLWDHANVALWNDTYARYRRRHYGFRRTTRAKYSISLGQR